MDWSQEVCGQLPLTKDIMVLQVIRLVLSNMFLHLAWALKSIDLDNPDDNLVKEVLTKRDNFMDQLQSILASLLDSWQQDDARNTLSCTVCLLNDLLVVEKFLAILGRYRF